MSHLSWSLNGVYLFASHATGGRSTVWEVDRWGYHQWDCDSSGAEWASPRTGCGLGGRQVLLCVERQPLSPQRISAVTVAADAANTGTGELITTEAAVLVGSPAAEASEKRQLGLFTAVKAYVFRGDVPVCTSHDQHTAGLGGEALLDVREDIARELLHEDFHQPPNTEVSRRRCAGSCRAI